MEVGLILFLDFDLESLDLLFGNFSKVGLELVHVEILSISEVKQFGPLDHEIVNLTLDLCVDAVFVHAENSELLLNLKNSELHIHGLVLDITDVVEQGLEHFFGTNFIVKLLLIIIGDILDGFELFGGDLLERISKNFKPLIDLLDCALLDLRVVDEHEVVQLLVLVVEVHVSVDLEDQNLLFDLGGRLTLVNLLLELGHFVFVEESFELTSLGPASYKEVELFDDLSFALDNLIMELRDHLVLHDIVKECVRDVLLSGLFMGDDFEDLAETVPPSTKLFGGLEDIPTELLKLGSELIDGWMESDLWMVVRTGHLDEAWSLSPHPNGLVGSKSSDNHLGNGVEDSSLPVLVVWTHLFASFRVTCAGLNSAFFNTLKVLITNVLIVLNELRENLDSVGFKEIREFGNVHWGFSVEVDLSDNLSILNIDNLLLNVRGMLENDVLGLSESVDSDLALSDVLINRQGEPVMVGDTLIHMLVELLNIDFQKLLFDWLQVGHGRLVTSQKLVEFVDVDHVVLFLKSNVNDCLWDGLADSIKELGFPDDDSKLTSKVDFVGGVLVLATFVSGENVSIFSSEVLDGLVSILSLPSLKDLLFIIFVELFGKSHILVSNILEDVGHELIRLVSELADGTLDSSHD